MGHVSGVIVGLLSIGGLLQWIVPSEGTTRERTVALVCVLVCLFVSVLLCLIVSILVRVFLCLCVLMCLCVFVRVGACWCVLVCWCMAVWLCERKEAV